MHKKIDVSRKIEIAKAEERNQKMLFRQLDEKEERKFRQWARETYIPFQPILGVWHPCVQDECRKMNEERGAFFTVDEEIGIA